MAENSSWSNQKCNTKYIIKTFADSPSDNSENLKKTADHLYFNGKNGSLSYELPLTKFSMHYDCDEHQNPSCYIALHIAVRYSSKDLRPILISVNNRVCEGALCQDVIGDFTIATAEERLYGPFAIDINDEEQKQKFITLTFSTSGYFPHISQFKFIPIAVYNISDKEPIYKAINWEKLIQQNESEHHDLDLRIVDAIKRRSLHKTKSYRNFTSNILFYADSDCKQIKPSQMSENMKFDNGCISCDGKKCFIEYTAVINRKREATILKAYDQSQFKLILGIEYSSPDQRPLQLLLNEEIKLENICNEVIKVSYDEAASWRTYNVELESNTCVCRSGVSSDTFSFTLKLQTDGLFPNIKSIMVMEEKEEKIGDVSDSESFLKLATHYREFITPPSDLISFEPFISSVKNICFDTYFREEAYTVMFNEQKEEVGITLNNETFMPTAEFYQSRNVDGLWICVSKNCEDYQQILEEATFLVKSFVPIEIRRLFLKYKHGRYRRKYVGPMRLIILSHTMNEKAGDIPELKTNEKGRNGTAQPFVFSSSDDFNRGFGNKEWFNGRLTAHELVHAMDMVIRQLIDPCFMVELDKIYNLAKYSGEYPEKAYAMTSRHEYIAEILTVFLNIPPYDLYIAGFRNKNDLKKKDIEGYTFLQRWCLELDHTLPVLDVFKKFSGTL